MKSLILMAGEGRRFKEKNYTFPKPLIDIFGKSMVEIVIGNLPQSDEYIFVCRSEHAEQYELEELLQRATGNKAKIINVNYLTEGAACTALLAKDLINNDDDLMIANSDQYALYNETNFSILKRREKVDGIIFSFNACHSKWSFIKVNENYEVIEVAEKKPISNIATVGYYWFNRGKDFVTAAENMIKKNIRINNEFYVAPVFNELVLKNKQIIPFFVEEMHGLGTPEDLECFIKQRNSV